MSAFTRTGLITGCGLVLLTACSSRADHLESDNSPAVSSETIAESIDQIKIAMETAAETRGPGHPTLWKMADEDTTVYLFGTVHLLPNDLAWQNEGFSKAFGDADTLYLEADVTSPQAQKTLQGLILQNAMFTDGENLSSIMRPKDYGIVSKAAETVGIPMAGLENARPWFASLQLSVKQIMKAGYNPESGVEQVMSAIAKKRGLEFAYFESAADQFNILSKAPIDEQIEGLLFTAQTIEAGPDMLDALVAEWADGDIVGMGIMLGNPSMFGSPEAYDDLIVKRNRNWVPQIEAILEDPGIKFVAVGAGHLAGPDSVIKMLEKKGYEIELKP